MITGFAGKPLNEVMAEEEFKRVMPIRPTPVVPGTADSHRLSTTPDWGTHPKRKVPAYVLCIPIKVYPHSIRFLDDLVQLDAQSLEKLKLHLLFLGGLQANAEFDDSDEEEEEHDDDDDEDLYLPSAELNRIVTWDAVVM